MTGAAEALWACSFALTCAAGLAFWWLPCDRGAALRGVAGGLGIALWLSMVVLMHFWPR